MPAAVLTFEKPRTLSRRGYKKKWGHFMDEAPRVGNGLRQVFVKEGRKWALIIGRHGRARLPIALWRKIEINKL